MANNRYIAIFILFCFSAFLGHGMVPHQHDVENILRSSQDQCRVDHNAPHELSDHPAHCHAFNGIHLVMHSVLKIVHPVVLSLFLQESDKGEIITESDAAGPIRLTSGNPYLDNTFIKHAIILRAPPVKA